jgi:replicative DNA helicase
MTPADLTHDRTVAMERAVLGGVLISPEMLDDAAEHLSEGDWAREAHAVLWRHMRALQAAGKPVEFGLLVDALGRSGELEKAGGALYLSELTNGVPKASNVGYYAEQVREYAVRRDLEAAGHEIAKLPESEAAENVDALLEAAERKLFRLRDRSARAEILTSERRGADALARIEALAEGRGPRGAPTGLVDLDRQTRGLQPGDLVVLAARPSMGKSALMLGMAAAAGATGSPALVVSLEMSKDELNLREVSMRARVDGWRLSAGALHQADYAKVMHAVGEMQTGGVHVLDCPSATVGQIRAICRRAKAARGLSLIAIDYLQLISPDRVKGQRTSDTRTLEVGEMTRSLKVLARDLNVPVLLLSQLSRAVESRTDKRPMLSDLRDSGAIEQDADVVLFVYRPWVYDKRENEREAEIIVAKQRNGPTGPVRAVFFKEHTRFADYSPLDEQGVA